MGALTMENNSEQVKSLLQNFRVVRECISCSGFMVPTTADIKEPYKGETLIVNIPAFKCRNCAEVSYGTGTLIKAIKQAKSNYDNNGSVKFEYKK